MVEAIANGIEDLLIDSLSFKLPSAARHITDRKSVTFYTSGSNEYSTTGTKLIKIAVNGEHWMDPSTLRVSLEILSCCCVMFFRRLRILCRGCYCGGHYGVQSLSRIIHHAD